MLLSGILMVTANGVATPAHIYLLGQVLNVFVYHSMATTKINHLGNVSLSTLARNYSEATNISCSMSEGQDQLYKEVQKINFTVLCNPDDGPIFHEIAALACDPTSTLISRVHTFSIYYVFISAGSFITLFLSGMFINLSAARQIKRIRQKLYRSLLHHHVEWFDLNSVNEVNNQLVE